MHLSRNQLESLKNYFKTKPVLKAYLFGSFAREQEDLNSDIDILVDLDYTQRIGLSFIQMQIDLEEILHSKVDLVSSGGLSKYILTEINKDKRLIYAR